jgi:hypothetical protein
MKRSESEFAPPLQRHSAQPDRIRTLQSDPEITIVDEGDCLAGLYNIVFFDQDLFDVSSDSGADRRYVTVNASVIG